MRIRIRKAIAEWQATQAKARLAVEELRSLELCVYRAAAEQHPDDEAPEAIRERIRAIRSEMKAASCDVVAYANRLLDECELPYSQAKFLQWAIALCYSEGFKRGRVALLADIEMVAHNERLAHREHPHEIKMVNEATKSEVDSIIARIQGGGEKTDG